MILKWYQLKTGMPECHWVWLSLAGPTEGKAAGCFISDQASGMLTKLTENPEYNPEPGSYAHSRHLIHTQVSFSKLSAKTEYEANSSSLCYGRLLSQFNRPRPHVPWHLKNKYEKKLSLALPIKLRFPNGKWTTDISKTARNKFPTLRVMVAQLFTFHFLYIFTLNCFTKAFKHACSYVNQTCNLVSGTGEALYTFSF